MSTIRIKWRIDCDLTEGSHVLRRANGLEADKWYLHTCQRSNGIERRVREVESRGIATHEDEDKRMKRDHVRYEDVST